MTLGDIRTRVRYFIRESSAIVWLDAELNAQINLAQRYIAAHIHQSYFPQLIKLAEINISNGDSSVAMPTRFMRVAGDPYSISTLVESRTFYKLMSLSEANKYLTPSPNSYLLNKPFSYIRDTKMYFNPAFSASPAGKFYLPFMSYPIDMSADGTSCEVQEGLVDLVIYKAVIDAMLKTRDFNEIKIINTIIDVSINELNKMASINYNAFSVPSDTPINIPTSNVGR